MEFLARASGPQSLDGPCAMQQTKQMGPSFVAFFDDPKRSPASPQPRAAPANPLLRRWPCPAKICALQQDPVGACHGV